MKKAHKEGKAYNIGYNNHIGEPSYPEKFFTKVIGFFDMGSSIAFFTKLSARQSRKELISFYFLFSLLIFAILFLFILLGYYFEFLSVFVPDIPYPPWRQSAARFVRRFSDSWCRWRAA